MDTTEVQLCEPMGFIWVYLQKYSEWLLPGAEMSQTSCITKAHLSTGDSSEIREPGAHYTAYKQLNRWKISF